MCNGGSKKTRAKTPVETMRASPSVKTSVRAPALLRQRSDENAQLAGRTKGKWRAASRCASMALRPARERALALTKACQPVNCPDESHDPAKKRLAGVNQGIITADARSGELDPSDARCDAPASTGPRRALGGEVGRPQGR